VTIEEKGGPVRAASPMKQGRPRRPALAQEALADCVLIVEDNPDGAESLRLLLEARGVRAVLAPDGVEGVRLGLELRPRAAVIDIGLPGLDGYAVCRRLRAALGPEATLVAHTAYAGGDAPERAREAGFDALLTKPTEPAELLRLLGPAR
jgi:CheY-like chemotaxis protein